MNYYGKASLASALKILLNIIILTGVITFLYVFYSSYKRTNGEILNFKTLSTGTLYLIGGLSLIGVLYNLRTIIDSLVKSNPFVISNVKSLRNTSFCCFVISVCYILNIILNQGLSNFKLIYIDISGIHTDIEFLIFFFAGCFILILSKVFKQAVEVKEENDFTI